jgi:RES domain-containing protein
MIVYRLAKSQFARNLSGEGAAMYPGRWNKLGVPVLYTGSSEAIAALEFMINASVGLVDGVESLEIEIPDDSITEIEINDLPENWRDFPSPAILAEIGNNWIKEGKTLAMRVPSSILPKTKNLIINPQHPLAAEIKILSANTFDVFQRVRK